MASLSIWSFPTRVVFGAGAARETGNEAKRLGAAKALVVTDAGVVATGLVAPIEEALRKAGVEVTIFSGVDPNPVEKNVADGVLAYRQSGAELIVAVGGGSPLDVGKIIRLKARPGVHERRLRRCHGG
jgi:4-hydroxybutyrate dehydrogenase